MTKHEAICLMEQTRCELECRSAYVLENDDAYTEGYLHDLERETEAFRMAIMALERWESPEDWVPVEEDLPAVGTHVLVTRFRKGERVVEPGMRRPGGNGWQVFGARVKTVEAWMPMPDPYDPGNMPKEEHDVEIH